MNGIDYLADTNAILYFLSGNDCMRPYIFCKFAFSIISEMELLSYSKITSTEETSIRGFLEKAVQFLLQMKLRTQRSCFVENIISNYRMLSLRQPQLKMILH